MNRLDMHQTHSFDVINTFQIADIGYNV